MNRRLEITIAIAAVLAVQHGGCSGCNADENPGADGSPDAPEVTEDTSWEVSDVPDDQVCAEQELSVFRKETKIMLLLDQSSSMMGAKWDQATDALTALLENPLFATYYFGLDAFPDGYPGFWAACADATMLNPFPCMHCPEDECGTLAPPQVQVMIHGSSAPLIIDHMNDPDYPQVCTFTPLVNQMAYYDTGPGETEAPEIYDPGSNNYLIVISDGEDEGCYDGSPSSALADHTSSILDEHGIKSIAIGFGSTSGSMSSELNAIASNGGTPYTTFLEAEDGGALEAALVDIASTVATCVYVLDDPGEGADETNVNFYVNDGSGGDPVVIPRDEGCTEDSGAGWDWVGDDYTTVVFCGDYCASILDGTIGDITATFGCPTILI